MACITTLIRNVHYHVFLLPQEKNKNTYLAAMDMFHEMTVHKRGHVEFIYAALREMENFGVHKDLEAYKKVLGVFPVGQMVSTNVFQVRARCRVGELYCAYSGISVVTSWRQF